MMRIIIHLVMDNGKIEAALSEVIGYCQGTMIYQSFHLRFARSYLYKLTSYIHSLHLHCSVIVISDTCHVFFRNIVALGPWCYIRQPRAT